GCGRAAVVCPYDGAKGGEPEGITAALVAEQVAPAASAGGAAVLGAAPRDGAGAGDEKQARPGAEGVVEGGLDVADDADLPGELEAGERIADRAALGLAARAGERAAEGGGGRRRAGGVERPADEVRERSRARGGVGGIDDAGGTADAGQLASGRVRRDDGGAGAAAVEAEVHRDRARAGAGAGAGVHQESGSVPAVTSTSRCASPPRPPRRAALAQPTAHVMAEPISANQSVSTTRGMRLNCWAAHSTVMTTMATAMPVMASRCSARRET